MDTNALKQPEPVSQDMLTVEEAAALLRLNKKTVYAAIQQGTFPGVFKVGRAIRIRRDALTNWPGEGVR